MSIGARPVRLYRRIVSPNRSPEVHLMLGRSTYDQQYVDACRAALGGQLAAYDELAAAASGKAANALEGFDPLFFNNLVLVLDGYFTHRLRNKEGKDGNPLNEVRVLAASLLTNDGVMAAEKSIKMKPESSVVGLAPGDAIALNRDDFGRLADAYFAELEARYVEA
jgi:hypothetical protein